MSCLLAWRRASDHADAPSANVNDGQQKGGKERRMLKPKYDADGVFTVGCCLPQQQENVVGILGMH